MTLTANGKAYIADQVGPRADLPMATGRLAAIALGTGTPTVTALGTETTRKALDTVSRSGAVASYHAHWDVDDQINATFTEAGLFQGTTLVASAVISQVKNLNDPLGVTWTLAFP